MKRSSLFRVVFGFAAAFGLLLCLCVLPVSSAYAGGCAVQQAAVVAPVYAAPVVAQVVAQPVYQQAIVAPVIAQPVYAQAIVQQSYGFSQAVVAAPIRQRVVVQRVRAPVVTRTKTVQRVVTR